MITLRVLAPHERMISCGARRRPGGKIRCEVPALHIGSHAGRSSNGRWYFW